MSQISQLAQRVLALEKARLQAKQPNLGHSTIDGGGAIQATDENDVLTMIVGKQFDQTSTASVVTGPTPPQPNLPFLTPQAGSMRIYWDGTFVGGAVAPMDFARVLAYAVPSSDYLGPNPLDQGVIVGQFTSATGGELTAALDPGVEYVVYFYAWSQAGKFSAPSDAAIATVGVVVDQADLASKNSIHSGPTQPWPDGDVTHADNAGDLWIDTSMGPGAIFDVQRKSVTANVATITLSTDDHDIAVGNLVQLNGVDENESDDLAVPVLDGSWTVDTVTGSLITFAVVTPDIPDQAVVGGTAQGLDVKAKNIPSIWDGAAWVLVQDSGAEAAQTLQDDLKGTQQDVAAVKITATDAFDTATAADGRVAISDYEPTPDDVAGKPEGSLWITRTRDRLNMSINPSFSTGVDNWSGVEATLAQWAIIPTDIGSTAARITNSATTSLLHYVAPTDATVIGPAEQLTVSAYARLISGLGTGAFIFIDWYDVDGIAISSTNGDPIDLLTGDDGWQRLYATGTAPEGTDHAFIGIGLPGANAGDVWELDGVLIELSDRLGRYFDGDSEGGSWEGTPGLSQSHLDGNAIIRLFDLEDGSWAEKFWTADTIVSVDVKTLRSGLGYQRPTTLDDGAMDGALLGDETVAVDKLYMPPIAASEPLSAGDLVNVWNNGGVPMVRRADASTVTDEPCIASGFVLKDAAIGDEIIVYTSGYNPLMSNLEPGRAFLSGDPGKAASSAPTNSGTIVQRVGYVVNANTLDFAPGPSIVLV
jgi:hypothetical protein